MGHCAIEVLYVVNGTTCQDDFTCRGYTVTVAGAHSPHGTVIKFRQGGDADGPVKGMMYRNVERIMIRPTMGQD